MTTERPLRKQSGGLFLGRGRLRRVQHRTGFIPVFYFVRLSEWTRKADSENKVNPCFPAVALRASPTWGAKRNGHLMVSVFFCF